MWAGFRMNDFFSHSQLCTCFGEDSVIDVLEGTNLEAAAAKDGYDVVLIRGAVPDHVEWAPGIDNMFERASRQA